MHTSPPLAPPVPLEWTARATHPRTGLGLPTGPPAHRPTGPPAHRAMERWRKVDINALVIEPTQMSIMLTVCGDSRFGKCDESTETSLAGLGSTYALDM